MARRYLLNRSGAALSFVLAFKSMCRMCGFRAQKRLNINRGDGK